MFGNALQPAHLILILVIALIVFGPGKLPEIGKSLGKTVQEFKRSMNSSFESVQEEVKPATQEQSPVQLVQASEKLSN